MGAPDYQLQFLPAADKAYRSGMSFFGVPEPQTLDAWAAEHFYLSKESSYVEQHWHAWPFQRPIMSWLSNDDIVEVDLRKSARVGYTKILLAFINYNAHHKRRNQAIWQPTDDDRDEFVKTELDPSLRDIAIMREVISSTGSRDKDNTLQQKKFKGSMLHARGGKAAKNYRRISVDVVMLDEYDAFDDNIEKEGDPGDLAAKRVEGATFPKKVFGTTPKLDGFSNIQKRERNADLFVTYRIPCPSCGEYHEISWGGKDEPHGLKWVDNDPDTVRHLCPHCGTLISQAEYLAVWEKGRYQSNSGIYCDIEGNFYDQQGDKIRPPKHIAAHVWSAYSPNVSWAGIVAEFLAAHQEMSEGKSEKMQTFTNTTLGNYWAQDVEKTEATEIQQRAEPYPLERVPKGGLLLLASVDTQDNRLECTIRAIGRGCESWVISHRILFGNPSQDDVWEELEEIIFDTEFQHVSGTWLKVYATSIDSAGHNTHPVYNFASKHARRRVFAVHGSSGREKHIKNGSTKVDIDWRGRMVRNGCILWWVGTNLAKDMIYNRLQLTRPGPGYIHFSNELSDEYFKQLTGEKRMSRRNSRGVMESRWVETRKRVEALDCVVYGLWLEMHLGLDKKSASFWDDLESTVQPMVNDMFAQSETEAPAVVEKTRKTKVENRESGLGLSGWKRGK